MFTLALLAAVGTVTSVVLQIRSKRPQLTAQVVSAEDLTTHTTVPELVVTSSFRSKPVERLWKVNIKIVNSGGTTLVGTGPHTNLIGDSITFIFPDWLTILTGSIDVNDPNVSVDREPDAHKFVVKFDQWRSAESVQIGFYLSATEDHDSAPEIQASGRSIVDGDIVVKDLAASTTRPKQPLLDKLPAPAAGPAKLVAVLSCSVFSGLLLFFAWKALGDGFRIMIWRNKFGLDFRDFIRSRFGADETLKTKYLAAPTALPADEWKAFEGRPLTVWTWAESAREAFALFFASLLSGASVLLFALSSVVKI